MKKLSEFIKESNEDVVYVIYLEDGTMYNYYNDKNEAQKEADSLNAESKCNKAKVKEESRKNFEKQ